MGFLFKSRKCRSLSISGGQVTDATFVLTDSKLNNKEIHIENIHTKPQKFLGSLVTYSNTPKEYFEHFHKLLEIKLKNIDVSKVRGQHQLAVYKRYALPSLRFHFSIHDMHKTHLEKLDNLAKKYIKKWLHFPTHGVTDVGIFHPYLLKVKQPSQIYKEGHAGNVTLMKLKGDNTVNTCLNSKLNREAHWKKKSSTAVECNTIFESLVATNAIITTTSQTTLRQNIKSAKFAVKKSVQDQVKDTWNKKVHQLLMQGDFASLLIEEENSITWQSIVRNMPRNVMSFAARLSTNSLNSPDNLVRWGKRKLGRCPLCNATNGTLAHIVNFCSVSLNQGRYTWRHDSVLSHITSTVKSLATNQTEVFADLPSRKVNGTTIPADILVTSGEGSRPDLVLINRSNKEIALMELTCSLPHLTQAATKRKTTHYTQLEISLIEEGYTVYLVPFEVCSNGHITKRNNTNINNVLKKFNIKLKRKTFFNLSKIALLCRMSVFHAYKVTDWVNPPLLSP